MPGVHGRFTEQREVEDEREATGVEPVARHLDLAGVLATDQAVGRSHHLCFRVAAAARRVSR